MRFLDRLQALALLLLRIGVAAIFFSHGWGKLIHPSTTMHMFETMGLPGWLGIVAGALETAGALLLVLGLFTRIFAGLLFLEMCFAIGAVHWKHAAWWDVKTYEPALACAVISFSLAAFGPGVVSVDYSLFHDRA
jgi:putative oxidoreductase